jgi:hypothetical protein
MRWYAVLIICVFLLSIAAQAQEGKIITLADNGETITLKVNDTFLLKLGDGYDWNITVDDQTVVSRVVNVLVVRGAQGIYIAHRPGSARLTAVGSPECLKQQPPCAMPSILFKLNVIVPATPKTSDFEAIPAILALLLLARRR